MAVPVFFISSKTTGWRKSCLKWAKDGNTFRIRDLKQEHLSFCQSLCQKWNYQHTLSGNDSVAVFELIKPE